MHVSLVARGAWPGCDLQGLESLLGGARGGAFDLGGNIWNRKVRLPPVGTALLSHLLPPLLTV